MSTRPIEVRSGEDFTKVIHNISATEKPEADKPLAAADIETLEDIINSQKGALGTADLQFGSFSLNAITHALGKLVDEDRIICLNRTRGRYCSKKAYASFDENRIFQERLGGY